MRLCAIAEEAIARGSECYFAGNISEIKWLTHHVDKLGFSQVVRPENISIVMDNQSVLVIDSYHIPVNEPSINPKRWKVVVSISDPLTPSYDSDLVINPGINYGKTPEKNSHFLFGPKYIPFRKSITKSIGISTSTNPRLLVFGGGTDYFGMAPAVAHLIRQKYNYREAIFIYHDQLEIESMDPRFKVFPFGTILDSIIDVSDVVITSASTSSFEILVRGIPTGVIRLVGNQDDNFKALNEAKLVSLIGNRSDDGVWNFSLPELEKLLFDNDYRQALREKSLKIFDFEGSSRILEKITKIYSEGV
jgi:spore coat polysaccharide biosynthesis predicted glycosyltransferase SpsG